MTVLVNERVPPDAHEHSAATSGRASFWEHMLLDELPDYRPQSEGLRPNMAHNNDRELFQIYRDLGHAVPVGQTPRASRLRWRQFRFSSGLA